MKRIKEYKKLFKVEGPIVLKELKTTYRGLVKEWHPDKFLDEEKKLEAEEVSTQIIDGYHFLVSIAPETKEAHADAYKATITESRVADYQHKSMSLEVTFTDGNTYEYFGVSKKLFIKFVNAKSINNFGKRNIFNSFTYRKSKKAMANA
ncbi:KTSC domain-containing protein [Tenacibaculum finnmarkense]|uniref:KTSC domain-containing protein n=1 Tax=Tenacibaculum finnmarkense genomovar finnmarkense TaxID=1458503 RepID=A0AAP1RE00_9FLAO|nr:KTSC domain-containing protein [Tenacibaculum finnmarkense]MBE7651993.1 KTSC domain-containing protein [Tenacibaculum finnmarkense genomovar finnmarkense]MBE7659044.1 KTSC domain-containing protein [Tenacibaculum finnmarkense genomovar finnmarkense]MBE7691732.1 KTSC domain-containing protein [Tenacibaculum finnmarkense genomovar finnmarkense]MBE7694292.1 KTSC domain-containing protein [Tenacibaculum finnmarkense genomovar finnmarkense]MCD8401761.1 KTSC domain-containing protein [Tenacibacul